MSALREMVRKIDTRQPGTRGYVTNPEELQAILAEVSKHVSVGVYLSGLQYGSDVSVTIKLKLNLERELL